MRIRYWLMTAVVTVGLVCARSAPALATTTSVFYDAAHSNLAATNNPFPNVQPSALDNMAAGIDALHRLDHRQRQYRRRRVCAGRHGHR